MRAGRSLLDQSYLSGLYDFLQAVDNPERFFANYGGRLAHSLTPFAGAQRTVTWRDGSRQRGGKRSIRFTVYRF